MKKVTNFAMQFRKNSITLKFDNRFFFIDKVFISLR